MLKIGDRVRVVKDDIGHILVGFTGEIIKSTDDDNCIGLDVLVRIYGSSDDYMLWFNHDELERVNDGGVSEER